MDPRVKRGRRCACCTSMLPSQTAGSLRRLRDLLAGQLGELSLPCDLLAHEGVELLRRILGRRRRRHAERRHPGLEGVALHHLVEMPVERGDDRLRRLGRRGKAYEAALIDLETL